MSLGKNIHNAFIVVFETLKSIEKLMIKCTSEIDGEAYHMPADRFMRYSSDLSWEGWIYWSFILLYQRKEDGAVMENGWINAPVYAVEINVDSDTCDEPMVYIAKMNFGDISEWSKGCSPSNHTLFYNAIHAVDMYEEIETENGLSRIVAKVGYESKVSSSFWGFQNAVCSEIKLVDITADNYKDKIFGTIEYLSNQ